MMIGQLGWEKIDLTGFSKIWRLCFQQLKIIVFEGKCEKINDWSATGAQTCDPCLLYVIVTTNQCNKPQFHGEPFDSEAKVKFHSNQ